MILPCHNSYLFSQLNENQDIKKKVEHNGVKRAFPRRSQLVLKIFLTLLLVQCGQRLYKVAFTFL